LKLVSPDFQRMVAPEVAPKMDLIVEIGNRMSPSQSNYSAPKSLGIHRKKVAFQANKRALVAFHRAHEMALAVSGKKLAMNNVNKFA